MSGRLLPRVLATLIVGGLGAMLFHSAAELLAPTEPPHTGAAVAAPATAPPIRRAPLATGQVEHRVQRGETLGTILARYGLDNARAIRAAALEYTDLAKLRAGASLFLDFERGAPLATRLRMALDDEHELHVDLATLSAAEAAIPFEHRVGQRELTVEGTLWAAAIDAGLRPKDILRLAQIFEYDVDFNTELRAGDRFTLVMDELWLDGAYQHPGAIHAARMTRRSETITAVAFEDPDSGELGWYSPDGTTRRKPFLRSPLAFSQVTSGYNPGRMDPIAHRVIAHVGTDFGAPEGTPVRAVGDGVVVYAGWNGGYGNYVKLEHVAPYHTAYAHLSAIAVAPGQRVKQGEIIGRVGSTGYSTGPHLHYEVHVKGVPMDAMKVKLPASGRELSPELMPAFEQTRDRWLPLLDAMDRDPTVADVR